MVLHALPLVSNFFFSIFFFLQIFFYLLIFCGLRFLGDSTIALASVSGPIEVRLASELPSKATFEVILRPLTNVPATDSKYQAATIRACLEPCVILTSNPRTLIQLVVQSLTLTRGRRDNLMAAMINASSLALLDSGSVYMRGVVCAVAVGRLKDGTLVVDPDEEEEVVVEGCGGGGCFAFMFSGAAAAAADNHDNNNKPPKSSDCVWSGWNSSKSSASSYDEGDFFKARELARVAAVDVYFAMKKSLIQKGSRGYDNKIDDIHIPGVDKDDDDNDSIMEI